MNWNIITDSSCDLLPSTSPDGRIRLTSVPFTIRIGERDFVDDEHLDTLEMLSAMEQERSAGHTSCPTPDAWLAQFEQADCAIAITISSQLSGSMNSALAARDMALEKDPDKKIVILDSLSTGPEVLLCVKEIERLIRHGLSFDDIAAHARGFLQKTKILFALSSFDNLIKNGHVYIATPPLYQVKKGKNSRYCWTEEEREAALEEFGAKGAHVQRYKGLGEMDAEQLWETTLNPETRLLKLVEIEDARMASSVTEMLMGSEVPPRRSFIYENATEAELDI